jgi:uncharacterized damage-inducible protein DinB
MATQTPIPDLRYPIGKFTTPTSTTAADRKVWIKDIAALPEQMRAMASGLPGELLDRPYRPGGWTVRQVVHHVADSHINSYVRYRLALTEDSPVVKGYDEAKWAELPDARTAPVDWSLAILEAVHRRWVGLLDKMTDADFAREFVHSERGPSSLATTLALYSWHGKHHLAHIRLVTG